jgi:hypothetical protein
VADCGGRKPAIEQRRKGNAEHIPIEEPRPNTRAVTGRRADIGGDAPGLVAGEPIGRQVVRRSDTSGIGGEAEVRGLCLK